MKQPKVHIVTSDSGWILEKLAAEITKRLDYVTYSMDHDPSAEVQYYITYGCRDRRISPIEVALFTHREHDPAAAERFDQAARDIDIAISMSNTTDEIIKNLGVSESICISPGVELDLFRPLVRIGVVGRTYHTGRKGEALVRAVMDLPGIEWHFTGEGWPGPAQNIDEDKLPDFYRSMDYVLVPAINEGGPMSVLESLACGTPVIASDVGWVRDFPHVAFETGNAQSLRAVLSKIVESKMLLAGTIQHMTWDNWAAQHDALFQRLFAKLTENSATAGRPHPILPRLGRVALLTHGAEDTTLGGPSVRVPQTQRAIQDLGIDAHYSHNLNKSALSSDIVHLFNIWAPLQAVEIARKVKAAGRTLIFSPIILDLSEASVWQVDLLHIFRNADDAADAGRMMRLASRLEKAAGHVRGEPEPGYIDALKEIARLADGIIFLSQHERGLFEQLTGAPTDKAFLVHNPVDGDHFADGDPSLFRDSYGVQDYVLCLARLEHRKNQLMLATALAGTGIQLVLAGHNVDDEYLELIKQFGDDNIVHVPRLEPGSEMLRSALAGARVFALPSWAEGAPLAALEAAAAGARLVLSDRSGENEYFGDFARYCDPADVVSIRTAIMETWSEEPDPKRIEAQKVHVRQTYSWQNYARSTVNVYRQVAERVKAQSPVVRAVDPGEIAPHRTGGLVFDITTWVNNALTLSGIVRVECALASQLLQQELDVKFVCYHSDSAGFVTVPRDIVAHNLVASYLATLCNEKAQPVFQNNDPGLYTDIVSVGSSWMQNPDYVSDLGEFARRHDLRLSILMHDMTPYLFPHWYPVGYAQIWNENCRALVAQCSRIIVYSQSTFNDLADFCEEFSITMPPAARIKLADDIGDLGGERSNKGMAATTKFSRLPFILAVGGIHTRKNYGLLADVWAILHEKMGDAAPHLVIVGGIAWNGGELARAISEDRRLKDRVHILTDIDDSSLAELYDHCLFTVYPSLYEGWGLPVGESLAHGKICLASNASSMKEIAPDYTDLLDPLDRKAWAALIQHYVSSKSARKYREQQIASGYVPLSWKDTTDGVVSLLDMPCPARQAAELYTLGAVVLVTDKTNGRRYLGGGWAAPEDWGCWSRSISPSLSLSLAQPVRDDLVFSILAKVMQRATDERTYVIRVNDKVVGKWVFNAQRAGMTGSDVYVSRVCVPRDVLGDATQIRVVLEADQLCAVKDVEPGSADLRKLGIGMVAFWIEEAAQSVDAPNMLRAIPSVRQALDCPASINLGTVLSDNPYRPAPSLNNWLSAIDYVQIGEIAGNAICAAQGMIRLNLGLARFALGQALEVQLALGNVAVNGRPAEAALFANGEFLEMIDIPASGTLHTFTINKSILGVSDPLQLDLVIRPSAGGRRPLVVIKAMCLSQNRSHPAHLSLDAGQDITDYGRKMAGVSRSRRVGQDWIFQGDGEIWSSAFNTQLDIDPQGCAFFEMDVCLLLSGREGDSLALSVGDHKHVLKFPTGERGSISAPCRVSGPTITDPDGRMRFRFMKHAHGGCEAERVEGDWRAICITSLRLLQLEVLDSGQNTDQAGRGLERVLWGEGWNTNAELDGGRWGIANRMEMKVMLAPGVSRLRMRMDCLAPPGEDQELKVAVDGVAVGTCRLSSFDIQSNTFEFVASDEVTVRTVTIEAVHMTSPRDLGLNEDPRKLSLRMWDIDVPALSEKNNQWLKEAGFA